MKLVTESRRIYGWLSILFLAAMLIRLIKLPETFLSSDSIQLPLFVIDSFPLQGLESFLSFGNYGIGNPLRLVVYPYSILQPILYFIFITIYSLLGISLTEFSLMLPTIFIGAITVFPVFLLIKELYNEKAALISCLFLAILPAHVLQSRYLSAARALTFLIQVLTVYFLVLYFKGKQDRYLYLTSIFFSLSILSSILFPPFILVILFMIFVFNYEKKRFLHSMKKAVRFILNPKFFLLPLLALFILVLFFLITTSISGNNFGADVTIIGHMLAKEKTSGFYLVEVLKAIYENIGLALFVPLLLIVVVKIKSLSPLNKKNLFLYWGLIYLLPFLFTKTSIIRVYLLYSAVPLALFVIVFLMSKEYSLRGVTLVVLFVLTLFSMLSAVYGVDTLFGLPSSEGSYGEDFGLKCAGLWIRENTLDSDVIYVDNLIEPPNAKYYFGRKSVALFDADFEESHEYFLENMDGVDYLVVGAENVGVFDGFYEAVSVGKDGGELLVIMSKVGDGVEVLDVSSCGTEFDRKYANLESLSGSPNYVSQFPAWI